MLFCPHCQQLEPTTHESRDDGSVAYRCKKCGGDIPLRRALRPGEIVAGFEIEEELGRGAMGIVYQARQTNLDREVAIKILSDDSASDEVYVERFFREARAAASLSHPNVVQAYDAGVTEDGIYYFVMEKITGENLELVLKNVGPLNVPQALDVFLSVANALAYAWSHNQLSHGDIKPENIIMRLNGKVKLADFGLARRAKDPELAEEDIRATPAYAPPEIINGDKNVPGFKSDMYSFGATAYHILVGHEPFVDADPMKVCAMQLKDVQTPLSELNPNIPRRLSDLVDALMEKDPENRPACWEDVVSELQAIRESIEAGGAEHPGTQANEDREKKPFPLAAVVGLAAAGLLAIVLIAGGAVYFARRGANRPPVGPSVPSSRQDPSPGNVSEPSESVEARDEAFFLAKWQEIQKDFSGSEPDLKRVEAFVAEAGHLAPAESVKLLQSLHARLDPDQTTNRVLMLRNSLLDQAGAFKADDAEEMDFFAVADLCETVKKQIDELKSLDASLKEHLLQPEQLKTIEAYYAKLAALLVDKSLSSPAGGDSGEPETPAPAEQTGATDDEPESSPVIVEASAGTPNDPNNRTTPADDLVQKEAKRVLSLLHTAIRNESERPLLIRSLTALLRHREEFADGELRQDCAAARRFLERNQDPMLPFLTSNIEELKGMVLFPKTNPDSRLEDLSGSTFLLRIVTRDGSVNIKQRLTWSDIRREEGEKSIVATLVNSPQLPKLSADFREYLFIRALFLGANQDALRNRYDRASGLTPERKERLFHTADLFKEPPVAVEDLIDALGELLDAETREVYPDPDPDED